MNYLTEIILGVILLNQVGFFIYLARKFSFSGTRSKIDSQIDDIKKALSKSEKLDTKDIKDSVDLLKETIENISVGDVIVKSYPSFPDKLTDVLETIKSDSLKIGASNLRIYIIEDRHTKEQYIVTENGHITHRVK